MAKQITETWAGGPFSLQQGQVGPYRLGSLTVGLPAATVAGRTYAASDSQAPDATIAAPADGTIRAEIANVVAAGGEIASLDVVLWWDGLADSTPGRADITVQLSYIQIQRGAAATERVEATRQVVLQTADTPDGPFAPTVASAAAPTAIGEYSPGDIDCGEVSFDFTPRADGSAVPGAGGIYLRSSNPLIRADVKAVTKSTAGGGPQQTDTLARLVAQLVYDGNGEDRATSTTVDATITAHWPAEPSLRTAAGSAAQAVSVPVTARTGRPWAIASAVTWVPATASIPELTAGRLGAATGFIALSSPAGPIGIEDYTLALTAGGDKFDLVSYPAGISRDRAGTRATGIVASLSYTGSGETGPADIATSARLTIPADPVRGTAAHTADFPLSVHAADCYRTATAPTQDARTGSAFSRNPAASIPGDSNPLVLTMGMFNDVDVHTWFRGTAYPPGPPGVRYRLDVVVPPNAPYTVAGGGRTDSIEVLVISQPVPAVFRFGFNEQSRPGATSTLAVTITRTTGGVPTGWGGIRLEYLELDGWSSAAALNAHIATLRQYGWRAIHPPVQGPDGGPWGTLLARRSRDPGGSGSRFTIRVPVLIAAAPTG